MIHPPVAGPVPPSIGWWMLVCVVGACGCTQNPFRPATLTSPTGFPQPSSAATLALPQASVPSSPPLPSFANTDPRQLETQLTRSRQEAQLAQDELAALREQLTATSTQLAQARAAARPSGPVTDQAPPVPAGIGPASMEEGMSHLAIPGATTRLDGNVVRIELPADKLFEPGTAALVPAGTALLSQAAAEVTRVFTGQFVGIEGHTDSEPLQNATWGSPHQLSVARASAVFEFLTARTALGKEQLFVVAHGPNHPVVSNATAAGRSRNRRIELVVYPDRAGAGDRPEENAAAPPAGS